MLDRINEKDYLSYHFEVPVSNTCSPSPSRQIVKESLYYMFQILSQEIKPDLYISNILYINRGLAHITLSLSPI